MFINPQTAIDNGWIRGIVDAEKQVQPNAIDFDINKLYKVVDESSPFFLDHDKKQHQQYAEQCPVDVAGPTGTKPYFVIPAHTALDFASSVYVELPLEVCALLIVRSTLNRNHVFITSGLYDSGFCGTVAGMIHNRSNNPAYITPGSMIGQIMFLKSENAGILYAGGYNTKAGEHWISSRNETGLLQ